MDQLIQLNRQMLAALLEIKRLIAPQPLPQPPVPSKYADKELTDDIIKQEAAWRNLGISENTFRKHVKEKLLWPVTTIGSRDKYSKREVLALLQHKKETFQEYRHMQPLKGRSDQERQDAAPVPCVAAQCPHRLENGGCGWEG